MAQGEAVFVISSQLIEPEEGIFVRLMAMHQVVIEIYEKRVTQVVLFCQPAAVGRIDFQLIGFIGLLEVFVAMILPVSTRKKVVAIESVAEGFAARMAHIGADCQHVPEVAVSLSYTDTVTERELPGVGLTSVEQLAAYPIDADVAEPLPYPGLKEAVEQIIGSVGIGSKKGRA